jgi:hypothetical protein
MTQYVINIGAIPNDGTGDPLRTAFNETNLNFNQVFAAGPVLSNIQIANNKILTTNTNGNLVLAPNGTGVVQSNVSIVPNTANIRNLGSSTQRWGTVYAQYLNVSANLNIAGNIIYNGDLTVDGNLTVQGNIIQVGNIVTDSKTIQLANTATTDAAANGSGITVGSSDDIATLLYNSSNNVWTTNIGLQVGGPVTGTSLAVSSATVYGNVNAINGNYTGNIVASAAQVSTIRLNPVGGPNTLSNITVVDDTVFEGNVDVDGALFVMGNVSADYFIGDGSQLTGLPATYTNANVDAHLAVSAGNIIPVGNNVQSLGNATNQWADLWVSNSTIYMNSVPITLGTGNVLTVNGEALLSNDSNTTITTTGNITADYFFGDGSQLTGLGATYSNANVITLLAEFGSNTLSTTGNISGGFIFGNISQANGFPATYGNSNVTTLLSNLGSNVISGTGNITTTANISGGYILGNGSQLTGLPATYGNADVANYLSTFSGNVSAGNVSATGNVTGAYILGNGSGLTNLPAPSVAQDITSNGAMSIMTYDGNIKYVSYATVEPSSGNIAGGNISAVGNISGNYFIGNGSQLTGLPATYDNADVATFLAAYGSNTISTTGNITAGAVNSNSISAAGFTGAIQFRGADGLLSANADVTWDQANLALYGHKLMCGVGGIGTDQALLTIGNTGPQQIHMGGNCTTIEIGNVQGITTFAGNVSVVGNVTGGNIIGNVSASGFTGAIQFRGADGFLSSNADVTWDQANLALYGHKLMCGNGGIGTDQALFTIGNAGPQQINMGGSATTIQIGNVAGITRVAGNLTAGVNVSAAGNVRGANFNTVGLISATGNVTGNFFIGNGSRLTGITAISSYNDANVATFLAAYGSNTISSTGNITTTANVTSDYFIGNGSQLTGITAVSSYGNAEVVANLAALGSNPISSTGNITTTANISGNYFIGDGSQLTGLPATYGNANVVANLAALGSNPISSTGNITTTANISGNYFIGNGSQLTGLPATYGNANVVANLAALGSNPISSTGNITSGNVLTGGLISATGNITATGNISGSCILGNASQLSNVGQSFRVTATGSANYIFDGVANDPTISLIRGQTYYFNMSVGNTHPLWIKTAPTLGTGDLYSNGVTNNGIVRGLITFQVPWDAPSLLYYQCQFHEGMGGSLQVVDATMLQNGNSTVTVYNNGNVATTVGGTSNVVVVSSEGQSITGNITSGNVLTGGLISAVGNISGNYFIGNGSQLTGIAASYGNANVATFLAAYGSNTVSTSGNITGGNIIGNISASGFTGDIQFRGVDGFLSSNVNLAWDQGNLALYGYKHMCGPGGFGTTESLLKIGNTTPTTIHMGGDATVILIGNAVGTTTFAGNVSAVGNVSGNYFIGNGSQLTGITAVSSYGNANVVANLAALGSNPISSSGNITGGNIIGNISAAGVIGGVQYKNASGYLESSENAFYDVGNLALYGHKLMCGPGGIGTTETLLSIGNATPIDIHIGGSATTVEIGNAQSVTTFNGNVSAVGNVTGNNLIATGNIVLTGSLVGSGASPAPSLSGFSSVSAVTLNASGNVTAGNVSATGNVTAANFFGDGNTLSNVATTFESTWTVPVGNSTQSFTVSPNNTYYLWVDCNIANGILAWNATATVTNTNVPVVGAQYAWVYSGGGTPIDFTSIPDQFVGTSNTIVRSSVSPSATTNRFDFGINNTSGNTVTVRYGYTKIS